MSHVSVWIIQIQCRTVLSPETGFDQWRSMDYINESLTDKKEWSIAAAQCCNAAKYCCAGKISMTVWYRNHFDYFRIYFIDSFLNTMHNLYYISTNKLNFHNFQCILLILVHIPCTGPCSSDSHCGPHQCWRQNMLVTNKDPKDVIKMTMTPLSQ